MRARAGPTSRRPTATGPVIALALALVLSLSSSLVLALALAPALAPTYGDRAFGLNHRCYWHLDREGRLWLSAEDGCEGVYPPAPRKKVLGLF